MKRSIGPAFFTSIFVAAIVLVFDFFFEDLSIIIIAVIVLLSAIVGNLLVAKYSRKNRIIKANEDNCCIGNELVCMSKSHRYMSFFNALKRQLTDAIGHLMLPERCNGYIIS